MQIHGSVWGTSSRELQNLLVIVVFPVSQEKVNAKVYTHALSPYSYSELLPFVKCVPMLCWVPTHILSATTLLGLKITT